MFNVKNVLIAGGGLMGKNIAFVVSSVKDYQITIYDINDVDFVGGIKTSTKQLVDKGIVTPAELEERLSRISFTKDMADERVKNADLVIEAVFENLDVKRATFDQLEANCRPDCIFCTNSSVMSPSVISANLKHRERFIGTHFWNPGHLIPLVEVIKTDATTDEVADTVMDFMAKIGKQPCLCKKDVPGFIANRLQHALWREAISIVERGIADAPTVDKAIKNSFGLRLPQLAPLENSDLVGTDLTYSIHQTVLQAIEDTHEPSPLLKEMMDRNEMGFKTNKGFYDWTDESKAKVSADLNTYLIKMLYGK
ncbi:MAG: 3-hydroxyacyl-CoA dehydrogenase family protein [Firmicutes bacterium]|nr:3-hydroxyacyl-CoA dehydrogenase family protein [Bacillota bacterium]